MRIAIIPARGGSKRIPGKNTRPFCGKPIIAYSIEAAVASQLFDLVLVSTDAEAVVQVAAASGAEVPFRRPAELADDHTPTVPVIQHAVRWVEAHRGPVSHACCIYATAPLLQAGVLQEAWERLRRDDACDYAFPITSFAFPIFRALQVQGEELRMFWPEHEQTRSQDLPEAYHDAGQFYWGTAEAWLSGRPIYSSRCRGVVVDRRCVQDIDTPEDWQVAEAMYRAMQ